MEEQNIYFISLSLCFCLFSYFLLLKLKKKPNKKIPPTLPSWPILGHLHLIRPPLHRFLQNLSYTYGPIFTLKFGSLPVVVVSSPALFEECFSKNDVVFANRPNTIMGKHVGYNNTSVGFANYGTLWRNLRKALTLNMMSTNRINAYYTVRKEEQDLFVKNLFDGQCLSYKRVEMRTRFAELTFNGVMRMATGKRYLGANVENEEEAKQFMENTSDISEMVKLNGANNFIKFLRLIDYQGYEKKMMMVQATTDMFLQRVIDGIKSQTKHAFDTTGRRESSTLVDEMLVLQESDPETYTDDLIKSQISQILSAGTETSSGTIEWAMALLLNHPEVLEKARAEIEMNIGHDELIDELNLCKVPYIHCIVNETLRLFPAAPILVPHMSSEDCTVGGYHIPRGTMLLANAWALQRDPNVWEDPTWFRPERFEGNARIDAYKFVAFGMGRRQCPGMGLSSRVVGVCLGVLIQCFEWRRISDELIDLSELNGGITIPMNKPLEAMCKPRQEMIHILTKL